MKKKSKLMMKDHLKPTHHCLEAPGSKILHCVGCEGISETEILAKQALESRLQPISVTSPAPLLCLALS